MNGLTVEERFQLCRSIGEECITGVNRKELQKSFSMYGMRRI